MTKSQLAERFCDELEDAIRLDVPVRLVYVGNVTDVADLLTMWEDGRLSL